MCLKPQRVECKLFFKLYVLHNCLFVKCLRGGGGETKHSVYTLTTQDAEGCKVYRNNIYVEA